MQPAAVQNIIVSTPASLIEGLMEKERGKQIAPNDCLISMPGNAGKDSTSAAKEGPLRYASLSWNSCGSTLSSTWFTVSSESLRMPLVHEIMICTAT